MHFFSSFFFYATHSICSSHAFLHFFVPLDLDIGKYSNALCRFFPALLSCEVYRRFLDFYKSLGNSLSYFLYINDNPDFFSVQKSDSQ